MPKIAIAAFSIESNSFAPGATHLDDFKNQGFVVGASSIRYTKK